MQGCDSPLCVWFGPCAPHSVWFGPCAAYGLDPAQARARLGRTEQLTQGVAPVPTVLVLVDGVVAAVPRTVSVLGGSVCKAALLSSMVAAD